jgi:hypothetical protein
MRCVNKFTKRVLKQRRAGAGHLPAQCGVASNRRLRTDNPVFNQEEE